MRGVYRQSIKKLDGVAKSHQSGQNATQNGATSMQTQSTQTHAHDGNSNDTTRNFSAEQVRQINNLLAYEADADGEGSMKHTNPVDSILEALTLQSIEKALAQVDVADYTVRPSGVEINSLFSSANAPPIYQIPNDNRPYVCILANGFECLPLLDSGSMVCIIVYRTDEELIPFKGQIEPCSTKISTISRENTQCTGLMNIRYSFCQQQRTIPTLLFKSTRSQFIVGINFWHAFGITFAWNGNGQSKNKPMDTKAAESTVPNDTKSISSVGIENEEMIMEPNVDSEPDVQPNGIFHIASHTQYARRIRSYVPRWQREKAKVLSIMKPMALEVVRQAEYVAPIYTCYESVEEKSSETQRQGESVDDSTPWSPVQMVLAMLRDMPQTVHVHEIQVQTSIRTAEGALDSINDITPEKHACISQPHQLTTQQQSLLDEVLKEFPYTPESGPLNITNVYTQRINTGEAIPQIRKQYPLSPYILAEVEKEIENLIARDIIEPIAFSPWRWPILWVKKKTGGGRICVDARGLNKITVPDAYPTLNVDTILRNLPKAKYISCLDMTQAFHQIQIHPDDRMKTSFAVGHRFFCFKRAIMGFINSPADLAKVLDLVFGDMIPNVYHYVDDFVLVSSTFEEHIELLRKVAHRLKRANLTISREKSSFCFSRVTFLGYVLTKEGLQANPERIRPILEYPKPKTVKELRRWVGLVGWYRRFIENAAELLAPLTDIMKGESKSRLEWTSEAEEAFIQTKRVMLSPAILSSPDYSLPFKIYTDASLVAGAAVLTQVQDGKEKVIAFHSAKFSKTQQNYSATERECLAVISGVEKFRPYIDGVPFTVVTDHSSLRWLQNLREPHGKLARWAVRLQAFDITFEHRPGRLMVVPDALSRAVDIIEIESQLDTSDKWYNRSYSFASTGKANRYKIENGILYRKGNISVDTGDQLWTVCLPHEKVKEALIEKHDNQSHIGFWKTLKAVQKSYYWPTMQSQIYEYVSQCKICKQIKPSTENTRVATGKYQHPISVGRVLSVDLVGPLPASKYHKHMWLMVAVDVFSKYVFAKSVTRATAAVITDWIEKDIFYKFNVPEKLVSDNGTQFTSEWFATFLKAYRVEHVTTPVYHPQPNQVEATNKSIKQLLRAELIEQSEHTDWASYVHKVIMRLNTNARMPVGKSPHFIVYGREKNMTGDEHRLLNDLNKPIGDEQEKREAIYEDAASRQRHAYEINRRRHDLRATVRKFKPGDLVYVQIHRQSNAGEKYTQKLAPLKKQAIIKEAIGSDTYILTDWKQQEIGKYHAVDIFRQ